MGHRTCSSSGIKTVRGAAGACSGLLEHRFSVIVQGHDMCDAGKTCESTSKCVKKTGVINKEDGKQESDLSFR